MSAAHTVSFAVQEGTMLLPVTPYAVPQSLWLRKPSYHGDPDLTYFHVAPRPTLRPKW